VSQVRKVAMEVMKRKALQQP